MTIRDALLQGQKILEDANVPVPRLTAEVLLIHAISHEKTVDRAWLFAHSTDELKQLWWIHYGRYLHERIQGKPTQYITGHQEFYGRNFHVTPDVLIPRPETEHLVEAAIKRIKPGDRVLDIGTGSGAIAVTLALETKAKVVASDISAGALRIARENARRLEANVEFVHADLVSTFADKSLEMVVSNPPYVALRDKGNLQPEVRDFEPDLALYAGFHGLDVYKVLTSRVGRVLKPRGWLILEFGDGQLDALLSMLPGWVNSEIIRDLAGIPRVLASQLPF
jgi:release factor glutamine methyltransferase